MLELAILAFSFLFNDIAQMPNKIGNIMCPFQSLFNHSLDSVLAIKVDVAQINVLKFAARTKQRRANLCKLTSLYFAK